MVLLVYINILEDTLQSYMIRFESEVLLDEIIENIIGSEVYKQWLSN